MDYFLADSFLHRKIKSLDRKIKFKECLKETKIKASQLFARVVAYNKGADGNSCHNLAN